MQDKVVVITGGAGGIGSAISQRMAAHGARVVIVYNSNAERANEVLRSLAGSGHRAVCAPVQDSAALSVLASDLGRTHGAVHALVNCHGITTPVPHADLDALSDEWIDRIFSTNWRGAFATVRALRPLLMAGAQNGEPSVIVNISSVAGVTGVGSNVAYCASKAALDSMTRSLARALAPHIRVVSVSPGWVMGDYATRFSSDYIAAQTAATPLRKLALPNDVADAVLAAITLLTNSTGCIIPVDGGRPLGV